MGKLLRAAVGVLALLLSCGSVPGAPGRPTLEIRFDVHFADGSSVVMAISYGTTEGSHTRLTSRTPWLSPTIDVVPGSVVWLRARPVATAPTDASINCGVFANGGSIEHLGKIGNPSTRECDYRARIVTGWLADLVPG